MARQVRVSASSRSSAVAGSIAAIMRHEGSVEVRAIGAASISQAVKALIIARSYLADDGIDLHFVPHFVDVEVEGLTRTAIHFAVATVQTAA